jgi:hypothetical protein
MDRDKSAVETYQEMLQKEKLLKEESILDEDGMFKDDDKVNPTHYESYDPEIKISCIDAMRAAFGREDVKTFCLINSFKYIYRSSSKGKNVDIEKAVWYLNKFLELGGYD